jgi:hypothetical protein
MYDFRLFQEKSAKNALVGYGERWRDVAHFQAGMRLQD